MDKENSDQWEKFVGLGRAQLKSRQKEIGSIPDHFQRSVVNILLTERFYHNCITWLHWCSYPVFILEDGGILSERIGGEERKLGGSGGEWGGGLEGSWREEEERRLPGNPLNPSEESQSLK